MLLMRKEVETIVLSLISGPAHYPRNLIKYGRITQVRLVQILTWNFFLQMIVQSNTLERVR